jgi:hypothetical protein
MTDLSLTDMAALLEGKSPEQVAEVAQAATATLLTPVDVWRAAHPDHEKVWQHLMERQDAAGGSGGFGNEFVDSLVGYLHKHGKLTDGQFKAALRGMDKAKAPENAAPVVVGADVTITGSVVSSQDKTDHKYGKTDRKMLVQDDRGFRVYGNALYELKQAVAGDRVQFTATVKASDQDPVFGFFSRAKNVKRLEAGEPAPVAEEPAPVAAPATVELAAVVADPKVLAALVGALGVTIAETDGSPLEHLLHAQLSAALVGAPIPATVELPEYVGGGLVSLDDC